MLEQKLAMSNKLAKEYVAGLIGKKRKYSKYMNLLEGENLSILTEQQRKLFSLIDINFFKCWKTCKEQLWEENRKFVYHQVNKFIAKVNPPRSMIEDLQSEAYVGFMIAIRMYSNSEFCFRTYLGKAIWTTLNKYVQRQRLMKGGDGRVLRKYIQKREELIISGKANKFEDVCDVLKLSKVSRKNLRSMLVQEEELDNNLVNKKGFDSIERSELFSAIESVELSVLEADSFKSRVSDLFPDSCDNFKGVATRYGVSIEAARQAYLRAKRKLAEKLPHYECN